MRILTTYGWVGRDREHGDMTMSERDWWYVKDGQRRGPITRGDLISRLHDEELLDTSKNLARLAAI